MSEDQIQQKKTLVLTNRIKRAAHSWIPLEMEPDQILLLNVITTAFKESNVHPDAEEIRVSCLITFTFQMPLYGACQHIFLRHSSRGEVTTIGMEKSYCGMNEEKLIMISH